MGCSNLPYRLRFCAHVKSRVLRVGSRDLGGDGLELGLLQAHDVSVIKLLMKRGSIISKTLIDR